MVIEFYKDHRTSYPVIRFGDKSLGVNHTVYKYILTLGVAFQTGVLRVYPACLDDNRTSKYVYRVREFLKEHEIPNIIGNTHKGYYYLQDVDTVIIPIDTYNYPVLMRCPDCEAKILSNQEHNCEVWMTTTNP